MTGSHKAPNQLMNFNNCLHHFTFHTTYSNQIDTDMYYVHVANIIGAILWITLRYDPASNMVRKVFFFRRKTGLFVAINVMAIPHISFEYLSAKKTFTKPSNE